MVSSPPFAATEVAASLLAYLRRVLSVPDLSYAVAPTQITRGYDTLVFAFRLAGTPADLASPLVLRVFRDARSGERARYERAVHDAVVALGYPAPRILLAEPDDAALGRAFIIMERLPGRTMLEMFFRPSRAFFSLAPRLAEQHVRLHSLDPAPLSRALQGEGLGARTSIDLFYEEVRQGIERARLDWLEPGMRWLTKRRPDERDGVICHGDFHPANMLMDRGAVTGIIDWAWVSVGPPEYDVGASVAIFSHGPIDLPGFLSGPADLIRRRFIRRYVAEYQKRRPLDIDALNYYEALRSLGFLMQAGEHWQADAGVIARPAQPNPFADARQIDGIVARFHELTGVELAARHRA
jgi:aminoglycoside phosphotransferase (APT) family kinase protein